MSLSPQWLDELRARVTLSAIIGRTTKLTRAGREYKACCPFHDEKSPSFTVNDEKGFYHCFGCGAHGDAIRWMTDQRGLSFMDAVKELAAEAGMELPAPDPRMARVAEQRASLHDVMAAAQDWFRANLAGAEGAAARAYLAGRGFDARTVDQFGFGFAPDSRTALKAALGQFDEALLIEAGLRIAVDGRDPYDRFRGRLMLPIQDARGRVIAFGGRILEAGKTDAPKYLNSPDTPLFDKGRTLYNLHRAGPASRQSGRVVVVEGYMDAIALAAAGIAEAVAPLGTALTEQQIEMLWRLVDVPTLCFDGDAAGQRAAMRAATRALPLLRPGHSLSIVRLPEGLDPDDLIRRDGVATMQRLLDTPASLLDTLWTHEQSAQSLSSPEDKAGLKARLLDHVETIADKDIRALYRRELMDRFSAFAFPPRAARPVGGGGAPYRKGPGRKDWSAPPTLTPETAARLLHVASGGARDQLAAAVVAGLLRFPDMIAHHAEALGAYRAPDTALQEALDCLIDQADGLEPATWPPISMHEQEGAGRLGLRYSFLAEGVDPARARKELNEAIALLIERPALDQAIQAATESFGKDPEGSYAEQQRLRKRKLEIEQRLGQMASDRAAEATRLAETDTAQPNGDDGLARD